MRSVDTIIVGGGIIGACILRRLTEAGHRCALIEQRRAGLGATGYSGAMVRLAHPTSAEIAAAGVGLRAYSQIEAETDGELALRKCGHLYFGSLERLETILPFVQAISPQACILSPQQIAKRFDGMDVTVEAAIFEPEAGFADPIAFTRHQVLQALRNGAMLCEATEMHHLIVDNGTITGVTTSAGDITASQVVLASGAQTPEILETQGLRGPELWSQRIQVGQFSFARDTANWPGFVDEDRALNGLPGPGPSQYRFGLPTYQKADSATETTACPNHLARTRSTVGDCLPEAKTAQSDGALCHPDCYGHEPIGTIGPAIGGPEGLFMATGFSGGGFKMAPYAADRIHQFLC